LFSDVSVETRQGVLHTECEWELFGFFRCHFTKFRELVVQFELPWIILEFNEKIFPVEIDQKDTHLAAQLFGIDPDINLFVSLPYGTIFKGSVIFVSASPGRLYKPLPRLYFLLNRKRVG
jgi:hypothetical protein